MQLGRYLQRIDYRDEPGPDYGTLRGLLRAHVCTAPFENLDVQPGRLPGTDQTRLADVGFDGSLDEPDVAVCWSRICERHAQLFDTV